MTMPAFISKSLNWIAKTYSNDVGNLLIHTGIAGFVLSSLAQITGIICNNKVEKEQKHYMINQEIGEAAINVMSLFLIGKSVKFLATKLVSTGKILPKSVSNFLKDNNFADKIGNWKFNVADTELLKNKIPSAVANDYTNFKGTFDSFGAVAGSIVSGALVAPVCRNYYASIMQNKMHPTQNPKYNHVDLSKYNSLYKAQAFPQL